MGDTSVSEASVCWPRSVADGAFRVLWLWNDTKRFGRLKRNVR